MLNSQLDAFPKEPSMRTPVFELHIKPMIRAIDREHMKNIIGDHFDLWDYEVLKEYSEQVLESLERWMPPDDKGGPWPDEWKQLIKRWADTGFKRLDLGKGAYEVSRSEDLIELVARFTVPGPGWAGWLELETMTEDSRTYVLYFERPDYESAGTGEDTVVSEQFSGVSRLFLRDREGTHTLTIPA
jgi:hypothetical protein